MYCMHTSLTTGNSWLLEDFLFLILSFFNKCLQLLLLPQMLPLQKGTTVPLFRVGSLCDVGAWAWITYARALALCNTIITTQTHSPSFILFFSTFDLNSCNKKKKKKRVEHTGCHHTQAFIYRLSTERDWKTAPSIADMWHLSYKPFVYLSAFGLEFVCQL